MSDYDEFLEWLREEAQEAREVGRDLRASSFENTAQAIERLERERDELDAVVEQRNAECSRNFKELAERRVSPRRLYDDDKPDEYQESDKDYVLNNLDLCLSYLDALAAQQQATESE